MRSEYPYLVAGRSILVVGMLVTAFVVWSLKPASTGMAVLLRAWMLSPHVALARILMTSASRARVLANVTSTSLIVVGGVLFLIRIVFADPDPQGAIAVIVTPLYQAVAMIVVLPMTRWWFDRGAHREGDGTLT